MQPCMDFSTANTEPFYIFHRFHESVNRLVKVISGALALTQRTVNGPNGKKILSDIIKAAGEPWSGSHHYDPEQELTTSTTFIAEMGIVRVDSAMEDFLISTDAEVSRCIARSSKGRKQRDQVPIPKEAVDERDNLLLMKLCKGCGWDITAYDAFIEIFLFFHQVRNCIVHRNGRITSAVAESIANQDFMEKWALVSTPRRTKPMALPAIVKDRLTLLPRHVVLFSSVCHKLASVLNELLRDFATEEGLLYMAVYHSLLLDMHVEWGPSARSAEAVINWALTYRYYVKEVTTSKTIAALKAADLWDKCQERYEALAPKQKGSSHATSAPTARTPR